MSDTPTKPGYYWARLHGGTKWYPVEIEKYEYDGEVSWCVYLFGREEDYSIDEYEFGPEITKPEGLE